MRQIPFPQTAANVNFAATDVEAHTSVAILGLIYGFLHVVGPDHLGTVMSLSVAATPTRAFSVGAWWSLGHTLGMACVAGLLVLVQHMFTVDVKAWESIGDYIIGLSMMLCGVYFLAREKQYVSESADGSASLKACECHGHGAHEEHTSQDAAAEQPGPPSKPKPIASGGGGDSQCEPCGPAESEAQAQLGMRQRIWAGLLGVMQGMCCPMGLMGLVILASLPASSIAEFILIFLVVSCVGTGTMALTWARFASSGTVVSTRSLYRASCSITILIGLAWVVAKHFGVLHVLNYAHHHVAAMV